MIRLSRAHAVPTIVSDVLKLRREKAASKPVIMAVVGASASGKGHLIDELIRRFDETVEEGRDVVAVLPLDNYYRGAKERASLSVPHFDHPEAVELSLAAKHLSKMRVGKTTSVPCYDFATGERVGQEHFAARPIVIVDGLFGLGPDILPLVDYGVFIETGVHSALLRRLFRDAGPRGRTKQSARDVLTQYFTTVWPAKRAFIDPTAAHADIVVESYYDAATEAARAGAIQCQSKAVGYVSDEEIFDRVRGQRIGGVVKQQDVFLVPRHESAGQEMLRLRSENGALYLTYKGPFISSMPGIGQRHVTPPIELDPDARAWFKDDYAELASFSKNRSLFHAGEVLIARDSIPHLGNFLEVRVPHETPPEKLHATLAKLGVEQPYYSESYFDLWCRSRRAA